MATFFLISHSSLSSCNLCTQHKKKHENKNVGSSLSTIVSSSDDKNSLNKKTHLSVSVYSSSNPRKPLDLSVKGHYLPFPRRLKPLNSTVKDEQESEPNEETEEKENQQEIDWKTHEEFKKFVGNPLIEAAIKLEKKRAYGKHRRPVITGASIL
ncbi:hypothetical protein CRYUN_Cryun10bG0107400 [Craigia yunnanensis]